MAKSEGLFRLAAAVRWIGYLIAGVLALAAVAATFKGPSGFALFIPAALCASGGWMIAWVIEGFAKR